MRAVFPFVLKARQGFSLPERKQHQHHQKRGSKIRAPQPAGHAPGQDSAGAIQTVRDCRREYCSLRRKHQYSCEVHNSPIAVRAITFTNRFALCVPNCRIMLCPTLETITLHAQETIVLE